YELFGRKVCQMANGRQQHKIGSRQARAHIAMPAMGHHARLPEPLRRLHKLFPQRAVAEICHYSLLKNTDCTCILTVLFLASFYHSRSFGFASKCIPSLIFWSKNLGEYFPNHLKCQAVTFLIFDNIW